VRRYLVSKLRDQVTEAKALRSDGNECDRDLHDIPVQVQRKVLSEIQLRLKAEPFREIKTRIKRLTGIVPPVCRLRIGVYRTYYRIVDERGIVLAILHKKDNERWLGRFL
jgi:mRNA-degrading endonuclease RelE of RelBE toxin-antitoxin system